MSETRFTAFISVAVLAIAGCSTGNIGPSAIVTATGVTTTPAVSTPIKHVVVIMQENRTVDHMFNGFPGADTVTSGMQNGKNIPLVPIDLGNGHDAEHTHTEWWRQWNQGKMDGFPKNSYSYIEKDETVPYWTMAKQYTFGDRMFQSNTGPSFVAHQYMIAGQSGGASENPNGTMWGCDAPLTERVPLIGPNGTSLPGVYPCFSYQTMADLLDAKGISWKYYAPAAGTDKLFIVSAFQAIRQIRFGADWQTKVSSPETNILTDLKNGTLAQVSWVVPAYNNSDHPGAPALGPDWVATVVNAIGHSEYWDSTAIFVSWDDWGGWYDHVAPPQIDGMGLGFRVPLIVVSPYAKRGYVSHVTHEASGMLRYIEEIFGLPSLGTRDAIADDFSDCFDYLQKPLAYGHVQTAHDAAFFRAQKPSGDPDTD